jgi:hypothetical protein
MSAESTVQNYLDDARSSLRAYKKMADKAIAQLQDEEFFVTIDDEANSVAVVMKHMAGNMFSRWTNFLNSDGEKPNRNRDMEFVIEATTTKNDVLHFWERGWQRVFEAIDPLQVSDFEKTVTIRGEVHTIAQALNRQLMHYSYHIGQIVFLAKHFRSAEWQSLSIPKNRSAEFNAHLAANPGAAADREKQFDAVVAFAEKKDQED